MHLTCTSFAVESDYAYFIIWIFKFTSYKNRETKSQSCSFMVGLLPKGPQQLVEGVMGWDREHNLKQGIYLNLHHCFSGSA